MEIAQIKQSLTLQTLLTHYRLTPDPQHRLRCPFHDDRTASLQLYPKTDTAYCFSTNCPTHGKSMDVIDFVMNMEKCSKHEALKKAASLIDVGKLTIDNEKRTEMPEKVLPTPQTERKVFLQNMFDYFQNGAFNSPQAKEYILKRGLDAKKTEIGYNTGQFHHGARKDEQLIQDSLAYGLLLDKNMTSRTGGRAYQVFGKGCIVFALRDVDGGIVSLYFRSTSNDKEQRHYYLRERQGLYPSYPSVTGQKLIITESIIDAATLLEQKSIKANYEILALFGTNGLTQEHQNAIKSMTQLQEIIFFLNGDDAGRKAVQKYAPQLRGEYPNIKISDVQAPENEDVNSLLQGHSAEVLLHLINERKEVTDFFSTEQPGGTEITTQEEKQAETPIKIAINQAKSETSPLDASQPNNLKYYGEAAEYHIKGFKTEQLDSLKITLQIAN